MCRFLIELGADVDNVARIREPHLPDITYVCDRYIWITSLCRAMHTLTLWKVLLP